MAKMELRCVYHSLRVLHLPGFWFFVVTFILCEFSGSRV